MIKVCILNNGKQKIGFNVSGHANYDEYGSDIVCAAVSILVQTTIGSVDEILKLKYSYYENEDNGIVNFKINQKCSDEDTKMLTLLIKSMELGIYSISKQYPDYVQITSEEVGL